MEMKIITWCVWGCCHPTPTPTRSGFSPSLGKGRWLMFKDQQKVELGWGEIFMFLSYLHVAGEMAAGGHLGWSTGVLI